MFVQVQEDFGFDQLGNTHIIVDIYYADDSTEVSICIGFLN